MTGAEIRKNDLEEMIKVFKSNSKQLLTLRGAKGSLYISQTANSAGIISTC